MMASTGKGGQSKKGDTALTLREQGHKEIIDLLRLADKSSNPEIRAAAIVIAKRSQGVRVNPYIIWIVDIALCVVTIWFCRFAFLSHGIILAFLLSLISLILFAVLIALSLFLSGHLSQSNFMKVLGWLESHIKSGWGFVLRKLSGRVRKNELGADHDSK
jgi:K+-sensing histidine kinase KdpD